MIEGKVTHPEDLQPAIEMLGEKGKAYLKALSGNEKVQPWMIAKAADFERENGES